MLQVAAVVLAAGESLRFGADNKLLASLDGQPLVRRVVTTILEANLADVVVVTGNEAPLIEAALDGLALRCVHNANWQAGQGASIATGVAALDDAIDGAFVVPADMPFLNANVLQSLLAVFERHKGEAPVYPATPAGAQRNPVLWPRRYFADLVSLSGQAGAKGLLQSLEDGAIAVPHDDETAFADIDTQPELEAAKQALCSKD